jgi:hypothetical protein
MNIYLQQILRLKRTAALVSTLMFAGFLPLSSAHAALLFEVDLSVENTISISSTNGASLISVSGSDFRGVYLDGFFASNSFASIDDDLVTGNLISANEVSDLSPILFRGDSRDPGLNIFSMTDSSNISFTAGALAFIGEATWTIGEEAYKLAMNGAQSGNLFFPADTIDDIDNAFILGSWAVKTVNAQVSEPSAFALFFVGLLGAGMVRVRRA